MEIDTSMIATINKLIKFTKESKIEKENLKIKITILTISTVLLFAATVKADSEDWKIYLRSSNSVASYTSLTKPDKNTREVVNSVQYGGACVYNRYRFDCKSKKWLQIEVAALPCGIPFNMAPGPSSNEWVDLNYKNTSKEIKKLHNLACKQ